jgi:signal transduction histidine kinase/ABC-type nitrate/sulfonate/bicarbonate transport system substrate-binding protein
MKQSKWLFSVFCVICSINVFTQVSAKATLDTVRVQLIYNHQFQFSGYYAAIEKGFYQDVGLKVNLLLPQNEKGSTNQIFSGEADFGVGSHGLVKKKSEGYPIVLLASILQHSPQALITSDNSGINNIKDLAGKRVMIEKHATDLIAFMEDEGLSENVVVRVPYDYDVYNLVRGDVDAMSVYLTDNTFILDSLDFPYRIISPLSGGIDFYGDSIFTTEEFYKNNTKIVNDFIDATIKGYYYALNNKEEIINLIIDKYNSRWSKNHLRYEAEKMEEFIGREIVKIGHINEGRWEYTLNVYKKLDIIDDSANLNGFFITDYNKDFFDKLSKNVIISLFIFIIIIIIVAIFYLNLSYKLKNELEKSIELEKHLSNSNATKDRLISILAHDLKNPFSGIISLSSLILMDIENVKKAEVKNSMRLIRRSAEDAYQMLKNLLEWVAIHQDGIKARPRQVALLEEYTHIFELYKDQAEVKKISLIINLDESHTAFVDPHMFEVIIRNLLANAIKFTNKYGKVEVNSEILEHKNTDVGGSNGQCRISISDNGIGMDGKKVSTLFSENSISSTLGTDKEKGTGLGLSICREFISANGGELQVNSTLGKGSTFSIILPYK